MAFNLMAIKIFKNDETLTCRWSESVVVLLCPAREMKQGVQVEDPCDGLDVREPICAGISKPQAAPYVLLNHCRPDHPSVLTVH